MLKRSSFSKKIKELLLNFLKSDDDYVEVPPPPPPVIVISLLCFILVYSIYCNVVSLLLFSP